MKFLKLLILTFPAFGFSQIDLSGIVGESGYYVKEPRDVLVEGRISFNLKDEKLFLTPSAVFSADGLNYTTFPRLGLTKVYRTSANNWNRFTFGLQALPDGNLRIGERGINTFNAFDFEWMIEPFVKLYTPIARLFNFCNCGAQRDKLVLEFVLEASTSTYGIGLGIRKRI